MIDEKFLLEAAARNEAATGPRKDIVMDIETAPHLAFTFQLFDARISPQMVVEHSRILCFAAKEVNSKRTQFYSEFHHGREKMLEMLWKTIDSADTIITWNGDAFDLKHIRKELMLAGFPPPREPHSIDVIRTCRRRFRLTSNKLDEVGKALGVGRKVSHSGWGLWQGVLDGDKKSWGIFKRYNIQDVVLTEQVYTQLLPWITSLPHASYGQTPVCGACGSDELIPNGWKTTKPGRVLALRCTTCGANNTVTARGKTRHSA